MSDKYKPWQDRKPKNKRYGEDVYRGRKGKERSKQDKQKNKNWINSIPS